MSPQRRRLFAVFVALAVLILAGSLTPASAAPAAQPAAPAFRLAPAFRNFYVQHQGLRLLGYPIRKAEQSGAIASQVFEKARLEDHRRAGVRGAWAFMYGRLTAELIERGSMAAVNGSDLTYVDLGRLADPAARVAPPEGYAGGPVGYGDGVFIPIDPQLGALPGHVVPMAFWEYMNRADLFPGGWLHDLGLPLTGAFQTEVVKQGQRRAIVMQAFERTVLTYDPLNTAEWQVERGNLGTDYLLATGALQAPPVLNIRATQWIEVSLAKQWMYAYEGGQLVMSAPVSTGRDGWNTPPGEFAIYAKVLKQTMRGNQRGEVWEVPDVPHVMYFTGDVALHGAYWHNLFGTGARLSHGCVNLPLEAAERLFAWATIGTPVNVY